MYYITFPKVAKRVNKVNVDKFGSLLYVLISSKITGCKAAKNKYLQ